MSKLVPCYAVVITAVSDLADLHLLGSTLSTHDLREQAESAVSAMRGRAIIEPRVRPA